MKKMLALLLALMMTFALCGASVAEELDLSGIEPLPKVEKNAFGLDPTDSKNMAVATADIVTVNGSVRTVQRGGVSITVDISPDYGVICLTQDMAASAEDYIRLVSIATQVQASMVANDIAMTIVSLSNDFTRELHMDLMIDDDQMMSGLIEMLDTVDEALLPVYMMQLAAKMGVDHADMVKANGRGWMKITFDENPDYIIYLTNAGDKVVRAVCFTSESALSEDEKLDLSDWLDCVTVA